MGKRSKIEDKAKRLWGNDLFKNNSAPPHCIQFESIFKEKWISSFKGELLEIGCGSGTDLEIFSSHDGLKKITAIDLGKKNIERLVKRYSNSYGRR